MLKKGSALARLTIGIATIAVIAAACSSSGSSAAPSGGAGGGKYTIGFANGGGVGNGWREASICSAKAQAADSGQVTSVTVIHHNDDAAGQLADIRDLIAKKVNAIVVNPPSPDGLNAGIAEATAAGIPVIAIDASVTEPSAYNLSNDQAQYAYLGASWLFKQLGGKGAVIYMRGIAGHPADTDRDTGFKKALAENPGITVAKETVTEWDPAKATTQINDILTSGVKFDGIWTSGIDQHRRRAQDRQGPARADRRRGQRRLRAAAPQRARPQGRGRDQPAGRRRRGRRARPADPRRQEAGGIDGPRDPGAVGQRRRKRARPPSPRPPTPRSTRSGPSGSP